MKRIVLTFGVISGVISSALMFLTVPFIDHGGINFRNGAVIGYTAIFLSLVLVFFGIRSYREQNGGTITFGRAFSVGILITVISCVFYVLSWEIIYFNFMPDFAERYSKYEIAQLRAKGANETAIEAKKKEMAQMKVMLDNPLTNAAMTFIEPFPVGLIMTLVSAGILRRRDAGTPPSTAPVVA